MLKIGNANITSLNASKINAGTLSVDRLEAGSINTKQLASGAVTGAKIQDLAIAGGKIANDAIINRHLTSGSVYTTTCNSTINGYFADIIEVQKIFAGTVVADYMRATRIYGEIFQFSTTIGGTATPWRLYVDGGVVKARSA